MEPLQALAQSDDPWAQQKGILALSILDSYSRGDISAEEYRELMQDMIRSDQIDDEATSLETKTAVIQVINAASMLV